jgi:DNA-directed RNA polymerase specialized sigma24 family protein
MTDELQRLLACMGRLDEGRRRLVLHAYFSGCTRAELAEQTSTPEATVRPRLRSAIAAIAEGLER